MAYWNQPGAGIGELEPEPELVKDIYKNGSWEPEPRAGSQQKKGRISNTGFISYLKYTIFGVYGLTKY